ncbi:MAG: nucleotide exchange factor GrpE [Candidatus Peregrinibacteria bacterium]
MSGRKHRKASAAMTGGQQHSLVAERERLKAELSQVQNEVNRFKDIAGRAQADLQNAKDRMQREARDLRRFAMESMFIALLPTFDNFDRAFKNLPEDLKGHSWVQGVSAIEQELTRQLSSMGLRKMECFGQSVDPMKHEVLQTGPGEEGKILEVFDDGYELNGKVLRPAKVKMGKALDALKEEMQKEAPQLPLQTEPPKPESPNAA